MGARVEKGTRLLLIICYGSPNSAIEHANYMHRDDIQKALLDEKSTISERNLLRLYS